MDSTSKKVESDSGHRESSFRCGRRGPHWSIMSEVSNCRSLLLHLVI
jgi:hypothetical protein